MIILEAKCKKCRRANQKLFLKGERCFGQKCAMTRRPYAPGVHGKAFKRRPSEYGLQLAEKQKARYAYGVSEKQFKNYFKEIVQQEGDKEILLVQKLENRLDNIVFRLGWANSRRLSRQLVNHGHILVNGRKIDIPSYQVKKGDIIKIKERTKKLAIFETIKANLKKCEIPVWISSDKQKFVGEVKTMPGLDNWEKVAEISRIVEFYSR
ncbi:30S ribosomal protein S4 [Patescibacteria group bacterium]|nr:30S ribosomal protein S4 [Patescibacteria group bacterium]MBU2579411.1 30S ribosomal protein S4 [Patescibacteria group bacterium]MCG2809154.1 30S ribosomal protein S4 [Candidatus Portnoybacteria bacterium]